MLKASLEMNKLSATTIKQRGKKPFAYWQPLPAPTRAEHRGLRKGSRGYINVNGTLQSFLLNLICFPALAQYKAADSFMITTPSAPALLGPAVPVLQLG